MVITRTYSPPLQVNFDDSHYKSFYYQVCPLKELILRILSNRNSSVISLKQFPIQELFNCLPFITRGFLLRAPPSHFYFGLLIIAEWARGTLKKSPAPKDNESQRTSLPDTVICHCSPAPQSAGVHRSGCWPPCCLEGGSENGCR